MSHCIVTAQVEPLPKWWPGKRKVETEDANNLTHIFFLQIQIQNFIRPWDYKRKLDHKASYKFMNPQHRDWSVPTTFTETNPSTSSPVLFPFTLPSHHLPVLKSADDRLTADTSGLVHVSSQCSCPFGSLPPFN